ncbi:MAG: hypothetical protein KA716_14635 [Gloeotrichia echinulata DEX184]|nr:hypothetical protein [Gloeotrichia echinulata DEX184]
MTEVIDFNALGNKPIGGGKKIIKPKISQLNPAIIAAFLAELQMPWLGIFFVSISAPFNP